MFFASYFLGTISNGNATGEEPGQVINLVGSWPNRWRWTFNKGGFLDTIGILKATVDSRWL
jgi:hypothetical protein